MQDSETRGLVQYKGCVLINKANIILSTLSKCCEISRTHTVPNQSRCGLSLKDSVSNSLNTCWNMYPTLIADWTGESTFLGVLIVCKLFNPHRRCGYSDLPCARTDVLYCRVQKWVERVGRWVRPHKKKCTLRKRHVFCYATTTSRRICEGRQTGSKRRSGSAGIDIREFLYQLQSAVPAVAYYSRVNGHGRLEPTFFRLIGVRTGQFGTGMD